MSQDSPPALILGTAQLGLKYGIANKTGKPKHHVSNQIVTEAINQGFSWIDTAQSYGNSEAMIGGILESNHLDATIITKLHPNVNPRNKKEVYEAVKKSLEKLKKPSIWGMMLHRSEWLEDWKRGIGPALLQAREEGLISKIGVSVYTVTEMNKCLENPEIELIQLPLNAWDPSFVQSDCLERAADSNRLCFFRSIFLQGLLLMTPEDVREKMPSAFTLSKRWWTLCDEIGQPPIEVAIRYVKYYQSPVVVGMEAVAQLEDNIKLMALEPLSEHQIQSIQNYLHPHAKKEVVNPTFWPV